MGGKKGEEYGAAGVGRTAGSDRTRTQPPRLLATPRSEATQSSLHGKRSRRQPSFAPASAAAQWQPPCTDYGVPSVGLKRLSCVWSWPPRLERPPPAEVHRRSGPDVPRSDDPSRGGTQLVRESGTWGAGQSLRTQDAPHLLTTRYMPSDTSQAVSRTVKRATTRTFARRRRTGPRSPGPRVGDRQSAPLSGRY